jgi:hypothetical protein
MISTLSRRSRYAAAVALPFLLAAKPLAAPMVGGTTYEFIVRSQSTASNKEMVMMRGRGTFAGTDGRIDILEAGPQGNTETFGGKGSYFLVLDAGKKMMLVDPTNKQYMEWDMQSMMAGMNKMVNAMGGMMKMEMTDVKIDSHDLGPGETIQGYATHHYQITQNYSMSMKMFGRSSKTKNESTIDYYFAPALKSLANPFVSNNQAWAQSMDMFNNPDYKNQMTAAMSKIKYGVPLKSVIKTIATDDKGKQQTSVVTSEMVNFHNTDVPASTFAIPAGYKQVEMPKMDASMAAGSNSSTSGSTASDVNADSLKNAAKDGAKEGVKEGVKEGAKEATKSKIRGIFKR